MNKKHLSIASSVCALGVLAVTYTQCGRSAHLFYSSEEEKKAMEQPIFYFSEQGPDTGVEDDSASADNSDSYIPSNPYKADSEPFRWVSSCNELESGKSESDIQNYIQNVRGDSGVAPAGGSSRDFELAVVKKIVEDRIKAIKAGEKLPLLIPVEYSFSTGDKHDKVSFMAYRRSILRNDHDGTSYITTGKQTYVVDHEIARSSFIDGKFKYYSYVEVKKFLPNGGDAFIEFAKGQPFDTWSAYNIHLAGSGLKNVQDYLTHYETKKELPVGKLFLADLRDDIIPSSAAIRSMYPDVAINGRNSEVTRRLKDIFNMKDIFQNNHLLTHAYALDRKMESQAFSKNYASYAGVPQLLHRLNCDIGSTSVIAAQYTPIVLDLGEPYIRTSSEHWGTFFNLAGAHVVRDGQVLDASGDNTFTHRTAWVGGYLKKVPNPVLTTLKPANTPVPYKEVWQRVAEDGFLVLPPEDNSPITASNLFGSSFQTTKDTQTGYGDGFLALQEYAGTRDACSSPMPSMSYTGEPTDEQMETRIAEIKKRYLGPWNPKFNKLKVWVDADRNGVAQASEVKGLVESGVIALNTCLTPVSEVEEVDRFGNNTKLRSAFLYDLSYASAGSLSEQDQKEILRTLALGKNSSGREGKFRLMVDIFFKARPFHFLERSLSYRESLDKKKYLINIKGNTYKEDDEGVPLIFD